MAQQKKSLLETAAFISSFPMMLQPWDRCFAYGRFYIKRSLMNKNLLRQQAQLQPRHIFSVLRRRNIIPVRSLFEVSVRNLGISSCVLLREEVIGNHCSGDTNCNKTLFSLKWKSSECQFIITGLPVPVPSPFHVSSFYERQVKSQQIINSSKNRTEVLMLEKCIQTKRLKYWLELRFRSNSPK